MMKKLLLIVAFTTLIFSGSRAEERKSCMTTENDKRLMQEHPEMVQERQALEQFTANYVQQHRSQAMRRSGTGAPQFIIPVVFHILHEYGPENISDEQVFDAVRIMNIDYRKQNADTSLILPIFASLASDIEVEFRLANIDNNGNCTNGIDRIVTMNTYSADDSKKIGIWDRTKYLNIWVVNSLANTGAAAYALYPSNTTTTVDGIMSRHDYVGSMGTSNPDHSRTLTHEAGHSFNLSHTWGSTNNPGVACGDDLVNDTPETMGWTTCDLNGSVCNPPAIENVQNYMDYSYCSVMFTADQKTRMWAALQSGTGGRNNLWQQSNLVATGTEDNHVTQMCAPQADFRAGTLSFCAGGNITFRDASWNGVPTSWDWSFPGGTPATSVDSEPNVVYSTPGTYSVTMRVFNSAGGDSLTRLNYIHISGIPTVTAPYTEDFEVAGTFPGTDGWLVNNDNGVTWQRVTTAGSNGVASVRISNYTDPAGQSDEWIMPAHDFRNFSQPTFSFKVANAQRNSSSDDMLELYSSINCGRTWSQIFSKNGATLATAGVISVSFIPTNAGQWRQENVSIPTLGLLPRVRFKFVNTSDHGNNTYIDEINVTGTMVNVDEIDDFTTGYAIYPNPTTGTSNVQFKLSQRQDVTLEIRDITGRLVKSVLKDKLTDGVYEYSLPELKEGIYLVDLSTNNKHHVERLIVTGK